MAVRVERARVEATRMQREGEKVEEDDADLRVFPAVMWLNLIITVCWLI